MDTHQAVTYVKGIVAFTAIYAIAVYMEKVEVEPTMAVIVGGVLPVAGMVYVLNSIGFYSPSFSASS